jgi:hypothetical protein
VDRASALYVYDVATIKLRRGHMNTRTIAILALVLVVIVILAVWVF